MICTFDGCPKPMRTKGLCNGHYEQKRTGRELKPLMIMGRTGCEFDGCDKPHQAKGLCTTHHWQQWKGQELKAIRDNSYIGYSAWHKRLRNEFGFARTYACEHCEEMADEWAFDENAVEPNEVLVSKEKNIEGMRFATRFDAYIPLCKACHTKFDLVKSR